MKKLVLLAMVGIIATGCNMEEGRKAEKAEHKQERAEEKAEAAEKKQAAQPEQTIEEQGKKAVETPAKS